MGEIGDASAIPALIKALKDKDEYVRNNAAEALGEIGDASAVPALMEAWKNQKVAFCTSAADVLIKIGIPSVPALIEVLKDRVWYVRQRAVDVLGKIGDTDTLPRKILAESRFSAQERINILEILRCVRYKDSYTTLRYTFPETRALCQVVLNEENAEAREGAQTVLNWLNGEQDLLHVPQPDTTTLPRVPQSGPPDANTDTLPRTANKPKDMEPRPTRSTFWQRLFGN